MVINILPLLDASTIPGGNAPDVPALMGQYSDRIKSRYESTADSPDDLIVGGQFKGLAIWVDSIHAPAYWDGSKWVYDIESVANTAAVDGIEDPRPGQRVWVVSLQTVATYSGSAWLYAPNSVVAVTDLPAASAHLRKGMRVWVDGLADFATFDGTAWQYDTGWITATASYASTWSTNGSSLTFRGRVRNGLVEFEGRISSTGGVSPNNTGTACTLLTAFRPPRQKVFPLVAHNSNRFGWLIINPDGTVVIDNPPTAAGDVQGARFDHISYRTT